MGGVQLGRSAGSVDACEQLAAGVQRAAQQEIERLEAAALQVMEAHAGVSHSADDACGGPVLGLTIALETGDIARFARIGDYAC